MRRTLSGYQISLAAMAAMLIALITATTAAAQGAPMPGGPVKEFSFTDARGSEYRLIARRSVGNLTGATVRINSPAGFFTVMEVLNDCATDRYAYAGMTYGSGTDPVSDAARAAEVQRYTDLDLASRLMAKDYFPIAEMGSEADKELFSAVCGGAD